MVEFRQAGRDQTRNGGSRYPAGEFLIPDQGSGTQLSSLEEADQGLLLHGAFLAARDHVVPLLGLHSVFLGSHDFSKAESGTGAPIPRRADARRKVRGGESRCKCPGCVLMMP